MRVALYTWKDLIDQLVDILGANPGAEAHRAAKQASLTALRNLASASRWMYYFDRFRIVTVAPYLTGTVAYDQTGGAYERVMTLTDGVWPSWAAQGTLLIDNINYEVVDRKSDTQITLSVASNPGQDLAAGTTYTLYRDTFPLPSNFQAMGTLILVSHSTILSYEHPQTWLERQRVYRGTALPRTYCVRGSPDWLNTLAISFFPPPDDAYEIDGIYERRPRDLKVDVYSTGTVSVPEGGTTLTGSGTAWTSRHVGCVIRLSANNKDLPTAEWGSNPPAVERIVTGVTSATECTVDDIIDDAYTGVKYLLSDPVDIETGAMLTALLRGCEYQLATLRRGADRAEAERAYSAAVILAREADSRHFGPQRVGHNLPFPVRLADMPRGSDLS